MYYDNPCIKNEIKKGKKIFAYGASTKGNTLLQFYGLDNKEIEKVADRNFDKWGRKTVGTEIQIVSEEQAGQQVKPRSPRPHAPSEDQPAEL